MAYNVYIITSTDPLTGKECFEKVIQSESDAKARLYIQNRAKVEITDTGTVVLNPKFFVRVLEPVYEGDNLVHVTVRSETYPYRDTYGVVFDPETREVLGCTCPNYEFVVGPNKQSCKHMLRVWQSISFGAAAEQL